MAGFRPVDPKQSFPELEERVLERWRERDVFQRSLAQREGAAVWSFYEGPPTANGRPGSHHVLARVFKDIYPRYRTMRGHQVPRKAGWDCHGLPVELEVEKQLGITSKQEIEEYGIAEFNEQLPRVGLPLRRGVEPADRADRLLDRPRRPLRDAGQRLHRVGLVVAAQALGRRTASTRATRSSPTARAAARRSPRTRSRSATRTSRTPRSTCASRCSPRTARDRRLAARLDDDALDAARQRGGRGRARRSTTCGRGSTARSLSWPSRGRAGARRGRRDRSTASRAPSSWRRYEARSSTTRRLRAARPPGPAGDFVTTEDGTGLVHTAPAFGEDDFAVAAENGIFDPITTAPSRTRSASTATSTSGSPASRAVRQGRRVTAALIADLEARGILFREQVYVHAYPHCWRCDTPLLYYAKSSWYVAHHRGPRPAAREQRADRLAPRAHQARPLRQVAGEQRRLGALARPLLGDAAADLGVRGRGLRRALLRRLDRRAARARGGEVPDDLHRPYIDEVTLAASSAAARCAASSGDRHLVRLRRDALRPVPLPVRERGEFEERFPADFICEAIDQTRGWFYTLLAESTLLFDTSSYRNCVCLGLILDPEGQKMSKSRGNVVDPWDVIDRHGADAFRWYYLTAQQPWAGYRFSVDTVGESVRQFLLTLWNTYSFWVLYANAEDLRLATSASRRLRVRIAREPARGELDRWALSRLQATIATVRERMDASTARPPAGRSPIRRRALQLVRAALAPPLLGGRPRRLRDPAPLPAGDGGAARAVHALPGRRDLRQPRRREGEELGAQPDSVHLCDYPEADAALSTPSSRRRWRRCAAPSSSAAPRAPRRR